MSDSLIDLAFICTSTKNKTTTKMEEVKNINKLLELLYSSKLEDRKKACALIRSSIESGERDLAYYQQYIPNFSDLSILKKIYENIYVNICLNIKISEASDTRCHADLKYYNGSTYIGQLEKHFPLDSLLVNSTHVVFSKDITAILSKSNNESSTLNTASFEFEPLYLSEINFIKQMADINFNTIYNKMESVVVSYKTRYTSDSGIAMVDLRNSKSVLELFNVYFNIVDQLKDTPPIHTPLCIHLYCDIFRSSQDSYNISKKNNLTDEMKNVLLNVTDCVIKSIMIYPTIKLNCRFDRAIVNKYYIPTSYIPSNSVLMSDDYVKLYEQLQDEQMYNKKVVSQLSIENKVGVYNKEEHIINYLKKHLLNKLTELICY